MTKNAYDGLSYSIKVASKQVAEKSMSDAAARLRGTEQTADVGVSGDFTWQRKGFSSKLGVMKAISIDNGKVLDVAILCKSWKGWTSMKKIASSDPTRYDTWKLSHNCNLNYPGSSPGMETAGATKIFSLSKKKYGLYCTSFYGDVTARHILLSKIYMVQVNLLKSLNVSVTIKSVSVRGFLI